MNANRPPSALPNGCTVQMLEDGGLYEWPATGLNVPSVSERPYSVVKFLKHVVVKVPSSYGFNEYDKYVVREETDNDAIRGNETIEKFGNLDQLLARYPSFRQPGSYMGDKKVHWLLLQMLQDDRLNTAIRIPQTKFVFFNKRWFLFKSTHPGLAQERVKGICLWDMIDHSVVHANPEHDHFVREECEPMVSEIASQLRPLTHPDLCSHINWHIKNFIFDPETHILYYLDLKPSSIFGRWRNEQNLRNIRRDFLR
ncbi:MAG: hypothetical protein ACREBG_21895 [Pyrinomonadaceae bacterium]